MYLQSGYSLVTTIHEENEYDFNVNIVIKNSLLDVHNSWRKEIRFKCEYCDQKFATRSTQFMEKRSII